MQNLFCNAVVIRVSCTYGLSHKTKRQVTSRGKFNESKDRRMTMIESFKIHTRKYVMIYYLFKYKFVT